jgi:hypothetical protein
VPGDLESLSGQGVIGMLQDASAATRLERIVAGGTSVRHP